VLSFLQTTRYLTIILPIYKKKEKKKSAKISHFIGIFLHFSYIIPVNFADMCEQSNDNVDYPD